MGHKIDLFFDQENMTRLTRIQRMMQDHAGCTEEIRLGTVVGQSIQTAYAMARLHKDGYSHFVLRKERWNNIDRELHIFDPLLPGEAFDNYPIRQGDGNCSRSLPDSPNLTHRGLRLDNDNMFTLNCYVLSLMENYRGIEGIDNGTAVKQALGLTGVLYANHEEGFTKILAHNRRNGCCQRVCLPYVAYGISGHVLKAADKILCTLKGTAYHKERKEVA